MFDIYPQVNIFVRNQANREFYRYDCILEIRKEMEENYTSLTIKCLSITSVDGSLDIDLDFGDHITDRWHLSNITSETLNEFSHKELLELFGYYRCVRRSKKAHTVEDICKVLIPKLENLFLGSGFDLTHDYESLIRDDMHTEEIRIYRGEKEICQQTIS